MEVELIYNSDTVKHEYTFPDPTNLYMTKMIIEFPHEITEDDIMYLCSFGNWDTLIKIIYEDNELFSVYIDYALAESIFNKKVSYSNNRIKFNIYTDMSKYRNKNIIGLKVALPPTWNIIIKLTSTPNITRHGIGMCVLSNNSIQLYDDYFTIITKKSHNLKSIDFMGDQLYHIDIEAMCKKETEYLNIYICHMIQPVNASLKEIYKHVNGTQRINYVINKICFEEPTDTSVVIMQFVNWNVVGSDE